MRELLKLWAKPDSRMRLLWPGKIQYWWNYFSKANVSIIVKRFVSIRIWFCWALAQGQKWEQVIGFAPTHVGDN
jgi:hypothetical protein